MALGTSMLLGGAGCAQKGVEVAPTAAPECAPAEVVTQAEQATLFRQAETDRADRLAREIERLQADLETAESALVEAESGLSGSHTRADAVSSVAVTRIQVERAASRAPWRAGEIEAARGKLVEAERQVEEGRFGAALFFVYRARRVAESILAEAEQVIRSANARLIRAERVNLRAGPSTDDPVLSVLGAGTPVIPQSGEGEWVLVEVTGGPVGWIHRSLIGAALDDGAGPPPAARR